MNIIILAPYFPSNYQQFSTALGNWGVNVLGIGDYSKKNLSSELKNSLTEYYHVDDMNNYAQLLKAVGYFTFKYGKIDRIESLNEEWLESEAYLRSDFNVFGIKGEDIRMIKDKSQMKKIFWENEIPTANGRVIRDFLGAKKFVKEVGYPVIAKTNNKIGLTNNFKIQNENDLYSLFKEKNAVDYIFEEYVDGDFYSYDGLTDRFGNIVFETAHFFQYGIMEVMENDSDLYYHSLRNIPEKLKIYGKKIVKAYGLTERFFHFEFLKDRQNNNFVALEINIRPSIGYTTDMYNYANDMNIYQEWANVVLHNKFYTKNYRNYYCCYIGRKKSKRYQYKHNSIMKKYQDHIILFSEMTDLYKNILGDYFYIVRSPEFNIINEICEFIQKKR